MSEEYRCQKTETSSQEPELIYSLDEEHFCYDTLEEAAADKWWNEYNDDEGQGEEVQLFYGIKGPENASHYLGNILDQMQENAFQEAGDYSDGWLEGKEGLELVELLKKTIDDWATANNQHPNFFSVTNVKSVWIRYTTADGKFEVTAGPFKERPAQ